MASVLCVLIASFLVYNWSCVLRYTIQAQTEADAAAELAVLPQVTQYNQLGLAVYTANVEEYRLRTLMESLLVNIKDSGGCDYPSYLPPAYGYPYPGLDNFVRPPQTKPAAVNCQLNYPGLRQAYIDSSNRYTQDVQLVEAVGNVSATELFAAPQKIVDALQAQCHCNTKYFLSAYTARERATTLGTVKADALGVEFKSARSGAHAMLNPTFTPTTADVTVCENITALLPNIFGKSIGPKYIVARSAATPIASVHEWNEPGLALDPTTKDPFQPQEQWGQIGTTDAAGYDWNRVNFSGNHAIADPQNQVYKTLITNLAGEFAAYTTWWSSAIVHPVKLSDTEQSALQQHLSDAGCN